MSMSPVMVEDPENETRWYFRYFLGRGRRVLLLICIHHCLRLNFIEHQNFAGIDNQKSPYFLSVLIDETVDGARCRAILWQSDVSTFQCFYSFNNMH